MKKFRRYGALVVWVILLSVTSSLLLDSCSSGVDVSGADKVLTSFSLTWPAGFDFNTLSNEPITVTIKAHDQDGGQFNWSGTVTIELTNANVDVSPASVNLANGIVERSISFDNGSTENQETNITLSSGGIATDLGVTLLVYTSETVQPTGFSLEWPAGFDYEVVSNEPLEVTVSALDESGNVLDWSGTVDFVLTNTSVTVSPALANLVNGSAQLSIAFNNTTVQNQETNIKLSFGSTVTELQSSVLVYEAIPPSDVTSFEAIPWDGQIRLSWVNPPETDFAGVRILRRDDRAPANAGDGDVVYEGDDQEVIETGLDNGTTYYYSAFSYDSAPNYSNGKTTYATPESHEPKVACLPGSRELTVFWTQDADADSYNLYYTDDGTDPGPSGGTKIGGLTETQAGITNLTNFHTYRVAVTAVKNGMESLEPDAVEAVPPGKVLDAGGAHSVLLKEDGTVWTWGNNGEGQLGNDGYPSDRPYPVQVTDNAGTGFLTDIVAVTSGAVHGMALMDDGMERTVWTWGNNNYGQLGDNNKPTRSDKPVQVKGEDNIGYLTGVVSIGAGEFHSVALKDDGTVWAWGYNHEGELGDGTMGTDRITPVQVVGEGGTGFLTGVAAINAGGFHALAVKTDGTVRAWGSNYYGQLGNGNNGEGTESAAPVPVAGEDGIGRLTDVMAAAGGNSHTVALKKDGTVWAWGRNHAGQLGDGHLGTDSNTPVQVVGEGGTGFLTGVVAVSASEHHSVAVKNDGTVWAWGRNYWGQLGDGNSETDSDTPVQVLDRGGVGTLTGIVAVAAGEEHTLSLRYDGTVLAWGYNQYGQCGDGNSGVGIYTNTPVLASREGGTGTLTDVVAISADLYHSVALKNDGTETTVWAWGYNSSGQLGDGGSPTNKDVPTQVLGVGGSGHLTGVGAIAAGYAHTLALKDDGTAVWAWGDNLRGQLGNNASPADSDTPVVVLDEAGTGDLTGVGAIAASGSHSHALKTDGTVLWSWGYNAYGQLGDNQASETQSDLPVKVHNDTDSGDLTGVGKISAGTDHTLALNTDGTVLWSWGFNNRGQLGDNSIDARILPVKVHGEEDVGFLTGVQEADGGEYHSVALMNDGTVRAWGYNSSGELGDGTGVPGADSDVPVQVLGEGGSGFLTGITQIAAGQHHCVALRNDGTVWTWGWNSDGQIGNGIEGSDIGFDTPVQVIDVDGEGFLTGIQAVAAGYQHSLALRDDGLVLTWGRNAYGQLGDGNIGNDYDRHTPVIIGVLYTGWHR